jgi:hypothetical protein
VTISRSAAAALAFVALGTFAACSGKFDANTANAATGAAAPAGHSDPTAVRLPGAAAKTATGTVLETMDASNYTYVRVKTDSGELWAAASKFKVAVGDTLTISLEQPMENFHSQSLNRDFPLIYFVSQMGAGGAAPAMGGHGTQAASAPQTVTEPIAPAKGGTTVAELWKSRKSLAGKTVVLRGKVVKYNGGILGVNWIHLQDGSGDAKDGSNDITITTDVEVQVGDVITVTGVLALDKDLGSGYFYPVIVEHATIDKAVSAEK